MNFADRLIDASHKKKSIAILGIDPQLDSDKRRALPVGYTLERFCCEIVEACADSVVAIKPQLAFFEARGIEGLRVFSSVVQLARHFGLITIADAKRGDIGNTSAAYAEAFLGNGDFACDAVCVSPYLGSDAIMPFIQKASTDRGLFVLVKTSNPSAGEFQDLKTTEGSLVWECVAKRVNGIGSDFLGTCNLSAVGAVVGATYPHDAIRARELMPNTVMLMPGYGAQGAAAQDAVAGARPDGSGVIVNASRSIMYAFEKKPHLGVGPAAADAVQQMRRDLNKALEERRRRATSSAINSPIQRN
jgi:orotidine-5'-phosphate decarboxylase